MQPIGQCTGLGPNIYLETNTNATFPYHNESSGGTTSGIDVDGDGNIVVAGSPSAASTGFVATIPVLSSLAFGAIAIAALSIML